MKKQAYKILTFAVLLVMIFTLSACKDNMNNGDGKDSGTAPATDSIIGSDTAGDTTAIADSNTDIESDTEDLADITGIDGTEDIDDITEGNGMIGDAISDIVSGNLLRNNTAENDSGNGLFPPETNFGQSSKPGSL